MIKGNKHSPETRQKISLAQKRRPNLLARGVPRSEETKRKISLKLKGRKHSEEHNRKMRASLTGRKLSETHKRNIGLGLLSNKHPEETKRKIGESNKGKIVSQETREKMSKSMKGKLVGNLNPFYGKKHSKETCEKISLANKGGEGWSRNWRIEKFRKHMSEILSGPRPSLSKTKKEQWKNPEFARKMMQTWHRKPNKAEIKLGELLEKWFPHEYRFTGGDGSLSIFGLIPDFTNCNGQKKVIEFYGTYWHRGQNPQDRIDKFAEFGFDCLVIWEHELKEKTEQELVETVRKFNEE